MANKVLPITVVLYLGYSLRFLFNNIISYSVFMQNILYIIKMNKRTRRQQL